MNFSSHIPEHYHGVIYSSKLNLFFMRIPKSASTYIRGRIFQSSPREVDFSKLKENVLDDLKSYELLDSLPFTDTKYFSQHKHTPMIIFVRNPLERCCSGVAELFNLHIKMPNTEPPKDYVGHMEHNAKIYKKYPTLIESMITDKISRSNTIFDLWQEAVEYFGYTDTIPENHLVPQSYWISEIMKVKDNLVFFEVNDSLHDNVTHYISDQIGTEFKTSGGRANNSYDKPISMFTNSYLKAKICDSSSNSPLRQSALEIYKEDIELYNSLKSNFYTLGEDQS